MRSVHTRFKNNLHQPIANLTKFKKGVYYSGNKIFNNLPDDIKDIANEIIMFLLINSFYNSDEYFNFQRKSRETDRKLKEYYCYYISRCCWF